MWIIYLHVGHQNKNTFTDLSYQIKGYGDLHQILGPNSKFQSCI